MFYNSIRRNFALRPSITICRRNLLVLGVETSCDDTGIAVLQDTKILTEVLSSQWKLLEEHGGVFPNLAAREHEINVPILMDKIFKNLGHDESKIDIISVAAGPGLAPCMSR